MRTSLAFVFSLALSSAAIAAPPRHKAGVIKRNILIQKRQAGTSVVTTAADGSMKIVLDMVENGRGPHFDETLRLAPDGTPVAFTAVGHHTFGAVVHEDFSRAGDHARWKSEEESGERDVKGAAFFEPVSDFFESYGLIVEAAVANGGKLPLLPGGEARVEKLTDMTVKAGAQSRHLTDYAVTGLDLIRSHVWMNDDGTFFGFVSAGFSFVPEGWESVAEPLVAKQEAIDRAHDAQLAATFAHKPPAAGLVYTHARVLDVEHGKWRADSAVLVVGDKIVAVGPTKSVAVPAGAEVVDLAGKALIPGMWDMHAHFGDTDGLLNIASGVTSIRDVGNDPD
ncbi:MAG TPA: hypothetical protein VHB97_27155, partial [Polyangia bacterium]|nr:hypothetical protein [Polyangia bacterium]